MNYKKDDQKIPDKLNNFFKNAVSDMNIIKNTYIINHNSCNFSDPVDNIPSKHST